MKGIFPKLKIVPTRSLVLHEDFDKKRTGKLEKRLSKEAILVNPVLVVRLENNQYLVLDGANRTTALQNLHIPNVLVQVVEYKNSFVQLETWNHLVVDKKFRRIYKGKEITFTLAQLKEMIRFVSSYKRKYEFIRVLNDSFDKASNDYKNAVCLVVFPKFNLKDIIALTKHSELVPSGITRHVVMGRALRVKIPLSILKLRSSIKANKWLTEFLIKTMRTGRVRYYAEPVFLFDE
jgi:L-serine kinase (ATP) / ParB family transcriptional regulator, heme-responsive regulator